ncbi:MAG: aminoacetone oxidase family FAD-binding enzyme, partial [Prevotella sp.]|nr:aminoacetone oxidase family FAD-binding enzyme [Prevotella sp.]
MKTAIVGGGAAGFFLAINLKEMMPEMDVSIFERSKRVLAKVEISGGGRCNCTNSFASVKDLKLVYPRGHQLMKRLFKVFDYHDAYDWFEHHGVPLVTQDDDCVFPMSQDSHTIIQCFMREARQHDVHIFTEKRIESLEELEEFDYVAITTGGSPRREGLRWLESSGVKIVSPVPSLFTFNVNDEGLRSLMGTVIENASVMIPASKMKANGALLITHWGMSGPAILKLSSYAARLLHENDYRLPIAVNWTGRQSAEVMEELMKCMVENAQKQLTNFRPFDLPGRLWNYLLEKSLGARCTNRWGNLNQKELNRLANVLCNDVYQIEGRAAFKDEFVTCGGISLDSVHPQTLECKTRPRLYFAGEILD